MFDEEDGTFGGVCVYRAASTLSQPGAHRLVCHTSGKTGILSEVHGYPSQTSAHWTKFGQNATTYMWLSCWDLVTFAGVHGGENHFFSCSAAEVLITDWFWGLYWFCILTHIHVWVEELGPGVTGEHVDDDDLPPLLHVDQEVTQLPVVLVDQVNALRTHLLKSHDNASCHQLQHTTGGGVMEDNALKCQESTCYPWGLLMHKVQSMHSQITPQVGQ